MAAGSPGEAVSSGNDGSLCTTSSPSIIPSLGCAETDTTSASLMPRYGRGVGTDRL